MINPTAKCLLWSCLSTALSLASFVNCEGQVKAPMRQSAAKLATPVYRTIITYDGRVCIAAPHFDVMADGTVVFKEQGMRFSESGYFWSPAIPDKIVRRGHYTDRIVGASTKYWPPVDSNGRLLASPPSPQPTLRSSHYSGRIQVASKPDSPVTEKAWESGLIDQAEAFNSAAKERAVPVPKPNSAVIYNRRWRRVQCTPTSLNPTCR